MNRYLIIFLMSVGIMYAQSPKEIAKALQISPASKASNQWIRIFKTPSRMAKFGVDKLDEAKREKLLNYLINHAADSDLPEVAGG